MSDIKRGKMIQESENKLTALVAEIERKFNVEILTMVVGSSTPVGHVKWILFLFFISLSLTVNLSFLFEDYWPSAGQEILMFTGEAVIAYLLAIWLSNFHFFQRFLTSDEDEVRMVEMRSQNEFFKNNFHLTKARNGILFFISKMERRVHIVADEKLSKILSVADKQNLLEAMVSHLKQQASLEDVFIKTLDVFSKELSQHAVNYPKLLRDANVVGVNELGNEMIKKD